MFQCRLLAKLNGCLNQLALAVIGHMLDKLSHPAVEILLTGNQLAINQLLVGNLYLFVAGVNRGLFMGEAALGFLFRNQPDEDCRVVHNVGLVVSSR